MNLYKRKGSKFDQVELVFARMVGDEDSIANFEFMFGSSFVSPKETVVDEGLSVFSQSYDICYKRNIEEHVAIENEGAR